MQAKILKPVLALAVAMSFIFISNSAIAGCRYVSGYWHHGYYHHGHRVCTSYHHCRWVGGYRSNGVWHNRHRVCNY